MIDGVRLCNQSDQMALVSGQLPGDVGVYTHCPFLAEAAKYCILFSTVPESFAEVLGLCMPRSCSMNNVTEFVAHNARFNQTYSYGSLSSSELLNYVYCNNEGDSLANEPPTMSNREVMMVSILGIWITIVCVATAYDYVKGVTMSSAPWQRVRRNSDGNIVHVVQPPTVVDRRSWRVAFDRSSIGIRAAALFRQKSTPTRVWRRKKGTGSTINTPREGTSSRQPSNIAKLNSEQEPFLSQGEREDAAQYRKETNSEDHWSPLRNAAPRGYGSVDPQHVGIIKSATTPSEGKNSASPGLVWVGGASDGPGGRGGEDGTPTSDADGSITPQADLFGATSGGEETTRGVTFGETVAIDPPEGGDADDRDPLDGTLSNTITQRLELWIGEQRLEALRERREALRQFVHDKMDALPDLQLPDLPDLPDFQSVVVRAVLCLSLLNSFRKWRYYPQSQASINIFNSLRVLAWLWIVSVDTFEYTMHIPTYTTTISENSTWLYALVQHQGSANFGIGTFLIISGFTTMHRLITSEERPMSAAAIVMANTMSGPQRVWGYAVWYIKYFFSRIVRVLPVYAAILFLLQPLLVRAGNGPFWATFTAAPTLNENCRQYWWSNMLLVNNILPSDDVDRCFPWSYYIALEFQLVLVAPVIHFFYKALGYRWFLPLAICLTGASIALRYVFFQPCSEMPLSRYAYRVGRIYEQPHLMFVPFLAGVCLYYAYRGVMRRQENIKMLGNEASMILLRHEKDAKQIDIADRASFWLLFRLRSKHFRVISIWLGLLLLISCVTLSWLLYDDERCNDSALARAFAAVAIVVWCVGLCLMILPMLFGFGGNVRLLLIHRLWCGVSRLVLAAYLLHPVVISFNNANKYAPASMEFLLFLVDSWGNIAVSLIVALLFHLGVEQPSMHLSSS